MTKMIGVALLMIGIAGIALAGEAPEIDPTSAIGPLTLLGGGALVILGRRRKR